MAQIHTKEEKDNNINSRKPFLRQLFICTGAWNCYFIMGLSMGTPTVLLPQLRASNVTVTEEAASWLPATLSYCGIPWLCILPILSTVIGRKKTFIVVNISCLIGNSILYFSKTINQIFISQIFQSACNASFLTVTMVVLTEFSSSMYRGFFLTLKSATFFWGILIANTIGTFLNWQNIALVGVLCTVYNLSSVSYWPESPYWLASKGKFDECSKSHKWLKGEDAESLKELENLLKSYECKRIATKTNIRNTLRIVCNNSKPILLSGLLTCLDIFSGKLLCSVYAVDILTKITKDNRTAYLGMLILDSVTVASMYLGCVLTKFLNRRTMLFGFSSLGVLFLLVLSGYLYLVKLSLIGESYFVSIALLAGYSVAVSCGPTILSSSIIGELLPLESKSVFMFVNALLFKSIFSTFLKISPFFFKYLNMHGTFLLYGILSAVFLVIIYFYLPETKNKTLQEIGESLHNAKGRPVKENVQLIQSER